jgi:hypothetical protein
VYVKLLNIHYCGKPPTVPILRWLVTNFLRQRPRVAPTSVHVGSVVDIVALKWVFVQSCGFPIIYHFTIAPYSLMYHVGDDRSTVPQRHGLTPLQQKNIYINNTCLFMYLFTQNIIYVQHGNSDTLVYSISYNIQLHHDHVYITCIFLLTMYTMRFYYNTVHCCNQNLIISNHHPNL